VEVALAFNQAEHAALLTEYSDRFFDQLPGIWPSLNDPMKLVLGQTLFPYPAASPRLLKRIDAALGAGDLEPGLARALIEGRDVVEKALRARALPA